MDPKSVKMISHVPVGKVATRLSAEVSAKYFDTGSPDVGPDQPLSKALRAARELGHNELVDLVSKKKDKGCIPSLYKPIWPTLRKAARLCEAKISIIRLLLNKTEKTENAKDIKEMRYYHPVHCSLLSAYEVDQCCDVSLGLFWEKERKCTSYTRSFCWPILSSAAYNGNNPLLEILIDMKVNLNYMDQYNQNPIMWAALAGRLETVKLLLEKGADANLTRDPNVTTLSLAKEFGLSRIGRKEPLWYQDEKEKRKTVNFLEARLNGGNDGLVLKQI